LRGMHLALPAWQPDRQMCCCAGKRGLPRRIFAADMKATGADKDAPFLPTLNAFAMWAVGMTSLYVVYKSALANAPKPVAVCDTCIGLRRFRPPNPLECCFARFRVPCCSCGPAAVGED